MDAGYLKYVKNSEGEIPESFLQPRDRFVDWLDAGRKPASRTEEHDTVLRARQDIMKQSTDLRPSTVCFSDLGVEVPRVECGVSSLARSLKKPFQRAANAFQPQQTHNLLSNLNGKAELGEMILVLAPPGSGVSSLLRVLSGQRIKGMNITGNLTYNGVSHDEKILKACYAGEEDDHLPSLSVERTFRVAAELSTKTGQEGRGAAIKQRIEYILKNLGLEKSRNTVVGNELLRGVSGGEKKRVSIGEALLMQGEVSIFDGWSRGLDSATAMRIGQLLRALTNISGTPCISALYQASPALYALYDKVLLLRDGQQLFFGTPQEALAYTTKIGLSRPLTQTVPDFMSSLRDPKGVSLVAKWKRSEGLEELQREVKRHGDGFDALNAQKSGVGERSKLLGGGGGGGGGDNAMSLAERYNYFLLFNKTVLEEDIAELYLPTEAAVVSGATRSPKLIGPKDGRKTLIATNAFHSLIWLCWREYHLTVADLRQYILARIGRYIFIGLLLGLLYFGLAMDFFGAYNREGLLATTTNMVGTGSFVLIPAMLDQRSVFYRQKQSFLFHPSIWPVAKAIFDIPLNFLEALFFVSTFYFMAAMNVDPFMKFVDCILFFFVFNMTMCNYTRLFVLLSKDLPASQGISGTSVIVFAFFNGFAISYDQIPVWWKWAYIVSPFSYMYKAIMLNEYDGVQLSCPDDPPIILQDACKKLTGDLFIKDTLGIDESESYKWYCLLMMMVFNVASILLCAVVSTYLTFTGSASVTFKGEEGEDEDIEENIASRERLTFTPPPSRLLSEDDAGLEDGTLVWSEVTYSIAPKQSLRQKITSKEKPKTKVLLKNVNGYCKPGTLMALMGSTGAGKTTLLDVLAKRKTIGTQEGSIKLDGEDLTSSVIRDRTGYVEQNDLHHPRTTIREAVRFSAVLRGADIEAADNMITLLGLDDEADAMVGGTTAMATDGGVSLVTKKRLTIAVELVSNPALLFLDEPTSGLDAEGAFNVMESIRAIADTGRSVVCTIHQPSPDVFQLFDSILLLHAGKMVYCGPTGEREGESDVVMNYFAKHLQDEAEVLSAEADYAGETRVRRNLSDIEKANKGLLNPADVIMSIINSGHRAANETVAGGGAVTPTVSPGLRPSTPSRSRSPTPPPGVSPTNSAGHTSSAVSIDWPAKWEVAPEAEIVAENIRKITVATKGGPAEVTRNRPGICTVFTTVFSRSRTILMRSPTYVFTRLIFTLFISLLFGTTYWQLGGESKDMRDYITLIYVSGNMGLVGAMTALTPILEGRPSFYREIMSGTYPAWVSAVSQVLTEVPLVVGAAAIWINVLFWCAGFPPAAYWYFAVQYLGLSFFMQFLGMAVAAAVPTFFLAQVVLPLANMMWSLHSGFIILASSIPDYLIEFHYANPLTYFLRSMVANLLTHKDDFTATVTQIVDPTGKTCAPDVGICQMVENQCVCTGPFIDPTGATCDLLPKFCKKGIERLCACSDFSQADLMLEFYGWSSSTKWGDMAALWGSAGFFMVLYIVLIATVKHIKR